MHAALLSKRQAVASSEGVQRNRNLHNVRGLSEQETGSVVQEGCRETGTLAMYAAFLSKRQAVLGKRSAEKQEPLRCTRPF